MRIRMTHTAAAIVAGVAGLAGTAPASASTPPADAAAVDCAAIAASFDGQDPGVLSTFLTAVDETTGQIVDTEPPFTAFIPVDAAFEALPSNVLDSILADEDMLAMILDYHLVPGQSLATADLAEAGSVETLTGDSIDFALDGETLVLNGGAATVICPDIEIDGAMIQVIDGILQSPSMAGGGAGGSSSVPGSSTPGSSVPGGAASAFDADQQAAASAWETVTNSSLTFDEQSPFIENAEALRATIDAYPAAGDVVGGIESTVTSVTIDGDNATVTYTLSFNGAVQDYPEQSAVLVRVDGSWIVPQSEYCAFQGLARNACPA